LICHWNQKPQQQPIDPFHAAQRQGRHKLKVTAKEQPSFPMKKKVLICNFPIFSKPKIVLIKELLSYGSNEMAYYFLA